MNTFLQWSKRRMMGSIWRAMMEAQLTVALVPILFFAIFLVRNNARTLTSQAENNVARLTAAKAQEIELRLQEIANTTEIAADYAGDILQTPLSQDAVTSGLAKYQADQRGILGLDVYYQTNDGATRYGDSLSNVFWPETVADGHVAQQIVQTEALDSVFTGIKQVSPDTQWIYLTTPDGMMRLYPWASNDHYPADWNPHEIIFYTVAEPKNNAAGTLQWTPPYVDFAGAGWMVTASAPMYGDDGSFLGVMSHDVTIESLKDEVLAFHALDNEGIAFLIDADGGVIAHPEFQEEDALKGTEEMRSLLGWGSAELTTLAQEMIRGNSGFGYYDDGDGESLLAYAPIESTGWSLGVAVPREVVVAPALQLRDRVITSTLIVLIVIFALAWLLSYLIHDALGELLTQVNKLKWGGKADKIEMTTYREIEQLADAFNEMAELVYKRESDLREKVALMEIQIDTQRRRKRVSAIVDTDFFQHLEKSAEQLRRDIKHAAATVPEPN